MAGRHVEVAHARGRSTEAAALFGRDVERHVEVAHARGPSTEAAALFGRDVAYARGCRVFAPRQSTEARALFASFGCDSFGRDDIACGRQVDAAIASCRPTVCPVSPLPVPFPPKRKRTRQSSNKSSNI